MTDCVPRCPLCSCQLLCFHGAPSPRADRRLGHQCTGEAFSAVTAQEQCHLLGTFWQDYLYSQRVCNLLIKHMVNEPHPQGILVTWEKAERTEKIPGSLTKQASLERFSQCLWISACWRTGAVCTPQQRIIWLPWKWPFLTKGLRIQEEAHASRRLACKLQK